MYKDSKTRSFKALKKLSIHVYVILHVYVMFCILLFSSESPNDLQPCSAACKVAGGGDQTKR